MCGITGFIAPFKSPEHPRSIESMANALRHRGPDDYGYWSDEELGVFFGHRRLSILDLSPLGHQPMVSAHARYVITFNGEIYNYEDLAHELRGRGHTFKGRSDTEVILAAFEEWGVRDALERFNGMFAFALWDRQERDLYLARDRMGEKPLYYGWNSGAFLFASELKSLTANPQFTTTINPSAAALAVRYSYIPTPWSIYENIYKLIPGTILKVSIDGLLTKSDLFSPFGKISSEGPHPSYFWNPPGLFTPHLTNPFNGSEGDAITELDLLMQDAVNIRMISDVPVGAFLSGGVDSSLIAALMQRRSAKPIKTFSIGFHDSAYDEAVYAERVARHLGTEHQNLYISPRDMLDVIPSLPGMYDEPFADSSQIPTYLVSKLCSERVTVTLSGDGGDELFAGYDRYRWALHFWSRVGRFPYPIRNLTSRLLGSPLSQKTSQGIVHLLSHSRYKGNYVQKLATASRVLRFRDRRALYEGLMSYWSDGAPATLHHPTLPTAFKTHPANHPQSFLDEMMAIDLQSYLPDDILVKIDRASMAVSLEARTPFLDHRVAEFALRLPTSFKLKGSSGKRILRQLLSRYVPESLTNRPKMGFSIPLGKWLRSDLRPWAEELLSRRALLSGGYFNPPVIEKAWKEHLAGTHNWEHHLWNILMFQAWRQHERDIRAAA